MRIFSALHRFRSNDETHHDGKYETHMSYGTESWVANLV